MAYVNRSGEFTPGPLPALATQPHDKFFSDEWSPAYDLTAIMDRIIASLLNPKVTELTTGACDGKPFNGVASEHPEEFAQLAALVSGAREEFEGDAATPDTAGASASSAPEGAGTGAGTGTGEPRT